MPPEEGSDEPKDYDDKEAIEWTQIDALKGSRLGSLLMDLREQMDVAKDAKERIEALRQLIAPLISLAGLPVKGSVPRLRLSWVPAGKTKKLIPALLVQAGVLPDQLALGWKQSPRKAYLLVRELEEEIAIPTIPSVEPSSSPERSDG